MVLQLLCWTGAEVHGRALANKVVLLVSIKYGESVEQLSNYQRLMENPRFIEDNEHV